MNKVNFSILMMNCVLVFWLMYFNAFHWIWNVDITYISFVIMGIYTSIVFFIVTTKEKIDDFFWFVSTKLPVLGLLGTVLGLMILFSNNIADVTLNDQEAVKNLMNVLFLSMGTALITTAIGIIANLLLQFQILLVERYKNGDQT